MVSSMPRAQSGRPRTDSSVPSPRSRWTDTGRRENTRDAIGRDRIHGDRDAIARERSRTRRFSIVVTQAGATPGRSPAETQEDV